MILSVLVSGGAAKATGTVAVRGGLGLLLVAPAFASLLLLVLGPAALSVSGTLFDPDTGQFSLASYSRFFSDRQSVNNLWFTLEVTLASLALLIFIGLIISTYLRFSQSRFAGAIRLLALFPLFVPGIIASFALLRFLGPGGMLQNALKFIGITSYQTPYLHASGAVIGLVWEYIPLTVMLLSAGLAQISNRAIDAARDVGAAPHQIYFHIILPQLVRPVIVVSCLNFMIIMGAFTVPYILGPAAPQMMSIFMQRTFSELSAANAAETQASVTFLVCLAVGAIYAWIVFRDSARSGAALR